MTIRYHGAAAGLLSVLRKLVSLNGFRAYLDVSGTLIIAPAPSRSHQPADSGVGSFSDPPLR